MLDAHSQQLKLHEIGMLYLRAALAEDVRVIDILGTLDVDLNSPDIQFDGMSPLGMATWRGQREMVEALIAAGADVTGPHADNFSKTPLGEATAGKHTEIEALLRAAGAHEPSAATIPECPHGHTNLQDVPVVYGYPTQEAHEAADRGEIILGGCSPLATESYVVCRDCGFRYDTWSFEWDRWSSDLATFTYPFPKLVADFPLPEDAETNYRQFIRDGQVTRSSVWFSTKEEFDEVVDQIERFLKTLSKEPELHARGERVDMEGETYDVSFAAMIFHRRAKKEVSGHLEATREDDPLIVAPRGTE